MNCLFAFFASFVYIALKALQQRHVMAAEYLKMPPLSMGMAVCEVFITVNVVRTADSPWGLAMLVFAIGSGASLGSMLGTWIHARKR